MSKDLALGYSEIEVIETQMPPIEEPKDKSVLMIERFKNRDVTLSFSLLKEFLKSPRHAIDYKLKVWKQTEDMLRGELCHMMMLESEKVAEVFTIINKTPSTENQVAFCEDVLSGIEPKEAFSNNYKSGNFEKTYNELLPYIEAVNSGKKCVSQEMYDNAKELTDYLKSQPKIAAILNHITETEVKVRFTYDGWDIIGFIDGKGKGIKIDLKFISDAEPTKVERTITNDKYYMQGGIYDDADTEEEFLCRYFVIACDQKKNYSIIEIDRSFLEYGKREYKYAISKLNQCIEQNRFDESYNFFDHNNEVRKLYKPKWIKGFDTDPDEV
jgi:hypothetical protein